MKRLMLGVVVAVLLAAPMMAQQQAITVSFNITAARAEILKEALERRPNMMPLPAGQTPPVVDDAYVDQWVTRQCRQAIDGVIAQAEREEARAGGPLDVSGLTKAQRLQVKALIASFGK